MTGLLFLFAGLVSVPAVWCQDNATLTTDDTTALTTLPASNTSEAQNNQTSPAATTTTSILAGNTTFPTQSPDVVSWYFSWAKPYIEFVVIVVGVRQELSQPLAEQGHHYQSHHGKDNQPWRRGRRKLDTNSAWQSLGLDVLQL